MWLAEAAPPQVLLRCYTEIQNKTKGDSRMIERKSAGVLATISAAGALIVAGGLL